MHDDETGDCESFFLKQPHNCWSEDQQLELARGRRKAFSWSAQELIVLEGDQQQLGTYLLVLHVIIY